MPETIKEVQIISREFIKPSSPTPHHLKTFKLSLLDQLIPAPYAPIVLFYPNNHGGGVIDLEEKAKKLAVLKQALSKSLSNFYPLAGIIRDDLSIDCNDQGAYYVTAMAVNHHLSEFLEKPDLHFICQFLPCDPTFMGSMAGKSVTNVQINLFECGGIAISLCISHKILDGNGLKTFLKSWAEMANGTEEEIHSVCPNFVVASSLFPANDDLWLRNSSMAMWRSMFKQGKSSTNRFVFDAAAITTLKAMAKSDSGRSNHRSPTRVETTSAFLWKCIKEASESINGYKRSSMLTHIVNLRKRATPTLSENSIGNLIWVSSAKCTIPPANRHDHHNQDKGLPELTDLVRHSISKLDGDYVKKLCDGGNRGSTLMRKTLKEIEDFVLNRSEEEEKEEEVDYLGFSSWCGFGFYEIDFGWGKPIWVSSYAVVAPVFMNLVILLETRNSDGIEAWVTLDEQEMDSLRHNHEILAFTSIDPSPLKI